jgi:hypothetical protein
MIHLGLLVWFIALAQTAVAQTPAPSGVPPAGGITHMTTAPAGIDLEHRVTSAEIRLSQLETTLTTGAHPQPTVTARPPRDLWDYVSQIAAPLVSSLAFVVAIFTLRSSIRAWKWTYYTKEWSSLMQFIQPQAKFIDPALTADYKKSFVGEDAMKYEVIARLCIGYLDDLYFLGARRQLRSWFPGSLRLFAGTHRQWLEDHKDAYDKGFYDLLMRELKGA